MDSVIIEKIDKMGSLSVKYGEFSYKVFGLSGSSSNYCTIECSGLREYFFVMCGELLAKFYEIDRPNKVKLLIMFLSQKDIFTDMAKESKNYGDIYDYPSTYECLFSTSDNPNCDHQVCIVHYSDVELFNADNYIDQVDDFMLTFGQAKVKVSRTV